MMNKEIYSVKRCVYPPVSDLRSVAADPKSQKSRDFWDRWYVWAYLPLHL